MTPWPRHGGRARLAQFLLLLLIGFAALIAEMAQAGEPVRIGVLAFRPRPQTLAQWQPLAIALKQAMPDRDFVVEAYSYQDLEHAVASRQVDFVLTNPGHYILLSRQSGLSAPLATLAMDESGQRTTVFGGVIFTRADQNSISRLSDVTGKTVAFVSPESLGAYQMQAYELSHAGIRIDQDVTLLAVGAPQDRVVEAVLAGRAEVGFVRTGILENMAREGKLDLKQLKVLNRQDLPDFPVMASTRLYPEWPVAYLPHINEDLARQVAAALFLLGEDAPLTRAMGIHGFAVPADYTPVSDLLRELRMPPFDATPLFTFRDVWSRYRWPLIGALMALGFIVLLEARLLLARRQLKEQHRITLLQKQQLEESEMRFKLAVEGAEEGVWDIDLRSGHIYHSPRMREMLGYSAAELPAERDAWYAIFHPDDLLTYRARVQVHFDSPDHDYENVMRLRHRNGSWRWIQSRGRALRDANGTAIRFSGTHMDVTERKRAEEEIARHRDHLEDLVADRTSALLVAKDAAEAASRAKSTFLANMSHELRTPMNAIMGMTDLALRRASDPRQMAHLQQVVHASRHLLAVINDILDISKIEADRLTLEESDFQVGRIMDDLRSLLGESAQKKGLVFEFDLPPDLAELGVRGDALRLAQILINLSNNALKFTEAGRVLVRARMQEETPDTAVLRFEVQDTGIGIAAADQARLFIPFEQADGSTTRKYGGSGLGLAICKQLVMLMGGDIGVDSAAGQGSCFWFLVRLGKCDVRPIFSPVPGNAVAEAELRAEFGGAHILLVEDDPVNQEVALGLLEAAGLQIDLAGDGMAALAMAERTDYALILMDMQMPRLNGLEATQAIRQLPGRSTTLILAMTANAFDEDRRRCLAAGMNDHIGKPIDPALLFATLLKWLRRSTP